MNCPVCKTRKNELFLERKNVPRNQNAIFTSGEEARLLSDGLLSMTVCSYCGFVWNPTFEPAKLVYAENYDNSQFYSRTFYAYVDDLVAYMVNECGVKNKRVLEVGCGNGYFLGKLVEVGDNTGVGYDPSYVGPLHALDDRLHFHQQLYDVDTVVGADVVVCRHVIEHIANPVDFLELIRQSLNNTTDGRIFCETPDVAWILNNGQIWDFYYEHCSLFNVPSITLAFARSGFDVHSIRRVFSEQYLWVEAKATNHPTEIARKFAKDEETTRAVLLRHLNALRKRGKIALLGAGAKGVMFTSLLDPNRELIECIIDLSPKKKFLPGTGHPIVDYAGANAFDVRYALLLNPNYTAENIRLLNEAGLNVQLIDASLWAE